jgi:hypothetical protein
MIQLSMRAAGACLLCLQLLAPAGASAQAAPTVRVSGAFDLTMTPAGATEREGRTETGRMLLDKQYFGELSATGKGQMLTAMTDTKGSAGYVAIERVTGTLGGKKGSFVIQHTGTMHAGAQHLVINIVPESGTGQLAGISGTMAIRMVERKHFYDLDYALPKS